MSRTEGNRKLLLLLVMLAVTVWGGLLALGALLYGYDPVSGQVTYAPDLLRGGIVLGCVAAFLGGWAWLAWRRFK